MSNQFITELVGAGCPLTYIADAHGECRKAIGGQQHAGTFVVANAGSGIMSRLGTVLGLPEHLGNGGLRHLGCALVTSDIRHVVLLDADLLRGVDRYKVYQLALRTSIRFWLVDEEPTPRRSLNKQLREWAAPTATCAQLIAEIRTCEPAPPPLADPPGRRLPSYEELPDSDFLFFAADLRRRRTDARFARALTLYWERFDDHQQWLTNMPADRDAIADRVWGIVGATSSPAIATVDLQALQAASLVAGLYVTFDLPRLLPDIDDRSAYLDPATIKRLSVIADPTRAACSAIHLMTAAPMHHLTEITIDDIAKDGSSVRVGGTAYQCPDHMRPLVRIGRLARAMQPETGDLLVSCEVRRGSGRCQQMKPKAMRKLIGQNARAADVPFNLRVGVARTGATWRLHRRFNVVDLRTQDSA